MFSIPEMWSKKLEQQMRSDTAFWDKLQSLIPKPTILTLCESAKEDTRRKILFAIEQKKEEMAERIVGYPIQKEDH